MDKYFFYEIVCFFLFEIVLFSYGQDVNSLAHQCNSTVRDGQGVLLSPNYPLLYDSNSFCRWQITVEENRNIKLTFRHFELERTSGCAYDKVMVYDGPSESHPLLGKYCGSFRPADVITTSNRMLMTFESDESNERSGFFAVFWSVAPQVAGPNSCGGLLTDSLGEFHSVNFPKSNYPNGLTCVWHIRAPENHEIFLRFTKLTLEMSANCKYDSITVYSGWSTRTETRFLGRFCKFADVPDEILSEGNEMFITFATDSSGNDVGFLASYSTRISSVTNNENTETQSPSTTPSESAFCVETRELNQDSGVITSPRYKTIRGYPPNLQCSWRITTSSNTTITLRFDHVYLEEDDQCLFDYIAVYSGRSESGNLLGKFCGTLRDQTVRSQSNKMFVVFVSDSAGEHPGFKASFNSGIEEVTTESTFTSSTATAVATPTTPRMPLTATATPSLASTSLIMEETTTATALEAESTCSNLCAPAPPIAEAACSSRFVAAVKLLSVNKLESGVARLRVSLVKMLKLEIEGVSGERRNKFWIDVQCPDCTPALTKRSKYILAGSDLEALGGQINPDDYIQVYTKSLQKIWKKEIKRCQRKFRKG